MKNNVTSPKNNVDETFSSVYKMCDATAEDLPVLSAEGATAIQGSEIKAVFRFSYFILHCHLQHFESREAEKARFFTFPFISLFSWHVVRNDTKKCVHPRTATLSPLKIMKMGSLFPEEGAFIETQDIDVASMELIQSF